MKIILMELDGNSREFYWPIESPPPEFRTPVVPALRILAFGECDLPKMSASIRIARYKRIDVCSEFAMYERVLDMDEFEERG